MPAVPSYLTMSACRYPGLLKLSRAAKLERTVCLLCLPPESMELRGRQSCAVTGYGLADSRDSPALQGE